MTLPKALQALLERLEAHERIRVLDWGELADSLESHDKVLLAFFSDPATHPENHDLAVILAELLRVFPALSALVPKAAAPLEVSRPFGVSAFPALVLVQDGRAVLALERIRPWPEYTSAIQEFLAQEA